MGWVFRYSLAFESYLAAWGSPKILHNVFGQWGGGIFNHAAIILIFFLQGYKMKRTELCEDLASTWAYNQGTQLGIWFLALL